MNKKRSVVLAFAVISILMLALSYTANAQTGGGMIIGARRDPTVNAPAKSRLLLNREPVLYLEMKTQVVEILPGGVNVLSSSDGLPSQGLTGYPARYVSSMRAGSNHLVGLRVDAGMIQIGTDYLQLDKDGILLDVVVRDMAGKTLAAQKLPLKNYEEAMVELATAANGKRLAVRFLPTVKEIEPLQDYPSLVPRFGTSRGMLIRNDKDLLSRNGFYSTVDNLSGSEQQFVVLESSSSGLLVMSYRPFPGAVAAGYFLDKELNFEWNGDFYEWISLDKPFLPEGRWALYVCQVRPSTIEGVRFSGFESDPNEVPNKLSEMDNALNRVKMMIKK
jgi:hypothetical protein